MMGVGGRTWETYVEMRSHQASTSTEKLSMILKRAFFNPPCVCRRIGTWLTSSTSVQTVSTSKEAGT